MKPKIVCIHLLNDYSGSPRILSQVISSFILKSYDVDLFTSGRDEKGFLSNLRGVNSYEFKYKWSTNKLITLFLFFSSQISLFFKLYRYKKQDVVFYVNTVLPIGAALAGKLMGKKVVYHIHETSIKPWLFKKLLFFIARKTATSAIYVSKYLFEKEPLKGVDNHVIYNTLSRDFITTINHSKPRFLTNFRVIMISSLKEYKGVREFLTLSQKMHNCEFELILNATQLEINTFFNISDFPKNLIVYPTQPSVHRFYQRANLIVNLSHPDKWVETFGLTALEAMAYSIPVIVPPVGGIAELVEDKVNGYKIDVRNTEKLEAAILELKEDREYYYKVSENAKSKSQEFNYEKMMDKIEEVLV